MKKLFLVIPLFFLLIGCSIFREPELNSEEDAEETLESETVVFTTEKKEKDTNETTPISNPITSTSSGETLPPTYYTLLEEKNSQINTLNSKVKKLEKQKDGLTRTIESLENNPLSHENIQERNQSEQIKFIRCASFSGFQTFEWYDSLLLLLENQKVVLFKTAKPDFLNPERIASSCYSQKGELLVMLISGDELGKGFGIARFDSKYGALQTARISAPGKSYLMQPKEFGKRNGNIIKLEGKGEFDNCKKTMWYDYDFIENEVRLKKECSKCPKKDEECIEF